MNTMTPQRSCSQRSQDRPHRHFTLVAQAIQIVQLCMPLLHMKKSSSSCSCLSPSSAPAVCCPRPELDTSA